MAIKPIPRDDDIVEVRVGSEEIYKTFQFFKDGGANIYWNWDGRELAHVLDAEEVEAICTHWRSKG